MKIVLDGFDKLLHTAPMMNRTPQHTEAEALAIAEKGLVAFLEKHVAPSDHNNFIARADSYVENGVTVWYPTIAARYIVAERKKKSAPWVKVGEVFGSCSADANDRAGVESLGQHKRAFNFTMWHGVEVRQHLKKVQK